MLKLLKLGWAHANGWPYKVFPPNGYGMVIVPTKPGERRALPDFRRDIRRRLGGHPERYRTLDSR